LNHEIRSSGQTPSGDGHQDAPVSISVQSLEARYYLHDARETVSNFLRAYGIWQRPVSNFLVGYLDEGDIFVDVGANIGYFTVLAGLCVGAAGRVHAVEPDADNAALLARNVALNGLSNVQLHRTAVSDHCGEAPLFRGTSNSGAHSLLRKNGLTAGPSVPVVTLDRLLHAEPRIKLLKIDVQGAEMSVLRGLAERLTAKDARPAIIMEFSPADLARADELAELFGFIERNDYSLRAFIANERSKTKPPQIRRATLLNIAQDFISTNDAAEFDILLLPHR